MWKAYRSGGHGRRHYLGDFFRAVSDISEADPVPLGTGTAEYFEFGVRFFRIYLFFIWLDALQPITSTFFTSIGKPAKGIFLSLTRQIIFLCAAAFDPSGLSGSGRMYLYRADCRLRGGDGHHRDGSSGVSQDAKDGGNPGIWQQMIRNVQGRTCSQLAVESCPVPERHLCCVKLPVACVLRYSPGVQPYHFRK